MSELFFIESAFGQFIIYTITLLFIIAVFVVVREIVRFQVTENEAFDKLSENYHKRIDWSKQFALSREELYETLKQDCPSESIAAHRLSSIYFLARQHQEIKQDVLVVPEILDIHAQGLCVHHCLLHAIILFGKLDNNVIMEDFLDAIKTVWFLKGLVVLEDSKWFHHVIE